MRDISFQLGSAQIAPVGEAALVGARHWAAGKITRSHSRSCERRSGSRQNEGTPSAISLANFVLPTWREPKWRHRLAGQRIANARRCEPLDHPSVFNTRY